MNTFTAVKETSITPLKKTDFLLFDKVAVPEFQYDLRAAPPEVRAGYEYLLEQGMVVNIGIEEILQYAVRDDKQSEAIFRLATGLSLPFVQKSLSGSSREKVEQFTDWVFFERMIGVTADRVEKILRTRAVPIIGLPPRDAAGGINANLPMMLGLLNVMCERVRREPSRPEFTRFLTLSSTIPDMLKDFNATPAETSPVVQITLEAFPVIDDSTPWEQVVDFRNDETTRMYSLALRRWMRKVTETDLTPIEIKEELEGLIAEYKDHMRFHKMKNRAGLVETVLTTVGTVAEHAFKREFGAAARALFQVRYDQLRLLESEREAPGREVAYIIKAREAFKS